MPRNAEKFLAVFIAPRIGIYQTDFATSLSGAPLKASSLELSGTKSIIPYVNPAR